MERDLDIAVSSLEKNHHILATFYVASSSDDLCVFFVRAFTIIDTSNYRGWVLASYRGPVTIAITGTYFGGTPEIMVLVPRSEDLLEYVQY